MHFLQACRMRNKGTYVKFHFLIDSSGCMFFYIVSYACQSELGLPQDWPLVVTFTLIFPGLYIIIITYR